jgi:hypothetical protein
LFCFSLRSAGQDVADGQQLQPESRQQETALPLSAERHWRKNRRPMKKAQSAIMSQMRIVCHIGVSRQQLGRPNNEDLKKPAAAGDAN